MKAANPLVRASLMELEAPIRNVQCAAWLAGTLAAGELADISDEWRDKLMKWAITKAWQAADELEDAWLEELEDVK
ncbi:hypothetical protein ACT6QG_02130 [Xanthobacter sp. TB0136]|uniref:hypothetical protein n=1 Tax=Xanthobacter sp. TB0136 TaxID=3459177 RepID=UPI004039402B